MTAKWFTINPVTNEITVTDGTDDDIRQIKELMTHSHQLQRQQLVAQTSAPAEEPELEPVGTMLSELFETFIERAQRDSREKTRLSMRQSFKVFLELVDDMPVNELSKDIACDFGDRYAEYPVSRTKGKWGKMTLDELHSIGRPSISPTTFNNNIRRLSTFGRWLVRVDKLPSNPFDA